MLNSYPENFVKHHNEIIEYAVLRKRQLNIARCRYVLYTFDLRVQTLLNHHCNKFYKNVYSVVKL